MPPTAQARFTALRTGGIDVLFRNSAQVFLRDASLGLNQGPVDFYDGQRFPVRRDSNVGRVQDLDGASVCVAQGTTHELNLDDGFRTRRLRFSPVVFEQVDTMYDASARDASALTGALTVAREPAAFAVLEETTSKEPLGPFARNGDDRWSNTVFRLHYALLEAEELGITRANAEERARGRGATAGRRERRVRRPARPRQPLGLRRRPCGGRLRRGISGAMWARVARRSCDAAPCTRLRSGVVTPRAKGWQPATRPGVPHPEAPARSGARFGGIAAWTRIGSRAPPSRSRAP